MDFPDDSKIERELCVGDRNSLVLPKHPLDFLGAITFIETFRLAKLGLLMLPSRKVSPDRFSDSIPTYFSS